MRDSRCSTFDQGWANLSAGLFMTLVIAVSASASAGWFTPIPKDGPDCIQIYGAMKFWPRARRSIFVTCHWAYGSTDGKPRPDYLRLTGKCFLNKVDGGYVTSKLTAYKAAAECAQDIRALTMLKNSFDPPPDAEDN
jgi:hypothetical protein